MPFCCAVPENAFSRLTPAAVFLDRSGQPVHSFRGYDHRIQFPVKLSGLPKHLLDVTVAAEDRRFFQHSGIDHFALGRAAWQLLTSGRIISGGSTITMQLVKMRHPQKQQRSLRYKFTQMAEALYYERHHGKEEILEQYFNVLPYGGKIFGIEAAAQYYFGRPAKDLNLAESLLLCGLPQAPSRLRPDRHPDRARKRFELVVDMLKNQNFFTPEQAAEILKMPLRYRDFSLPFLPAAEDPQYFYAALRQAREKNPDAWLIHTAYDPVLTKTVIQVLKNQLPQDGTVQDAAAAVQENATGKIRTLIGTLDFQHPVNGQVNAALAQRSPGSLLKVFFYGEAIYGGLILPETKLPDAPIANSDYRPENSDSTYMGMVSAETALTRSLNTPAVRLLRDLGVIRMLKKLKELGIVQTEKNTSGLALALGGEESSLLALTNAYSALPRNRFFPSPDLLEYTEERQTVPVWKHDSVAPLLLKMMRSLPLPGAEHLPAAWKTGTSNNSRDAWCIAVTPEYTVGIWFGNKNGKQSHHLTGYDIAAPAAGKIISGLYDGTRWQQASRLKQTQLCAVSGLTPAAYCPQERITAERIPEIPVRPCNMCHPGAKKLEIFEPAEKTCKIKPGEKTVQILLNFSPSPLSCYHNGQYIGEKKSGEKLYLPEGSHILRFWDTETGSSRKVGITVLPPEIN